MPKSDQKISPNRYQVVPRTLIFITRGSQVLMLKGSPHKRLWANKYNGIGGHIECGEDILSSARRELREEAGIEVPDLHLCGVIMVDASDDAGIGIFVLKGEYQGGKLIESQEGQLEWIEASHLKDYPLLEDLMILLPRVLSSKRADPPFSASYSYDTGDNLVINFGK